jgi:hypothetical protein
VRDRQPAQAIVRIQSLQTEKKSAVPKLLARRKIMPTTLPRKQHAL